MAQDISETQRTNTGKVEQDEQKPSGIGKLLRIFDARLYRYHIRYEPTSLWAYVVESTVLRSVGWIPGLLGGLVRNIAYQPIFKTLGKRAVVQGNVQLNGWHLESEICLKDFAYLDRGVNITVHDRGRIEVGDRSYIGPYTCIAGPGPVIIGKQCLISSHCGIYGNNHVFDDPNAYIRHQGFTHEGITLEDDCWLGTGVRVLDGVTIGQGSVVGAGPVA